MDLNAVRIFVKVVQAGSFVGAANQLKIPSSTVSAKVSSLERRLGVTLLHRTTRKLNLTQVGNTYFQHCVSALEEIQSVESEIDSSKLEPSGLLSVTAPVDLGNACLVDLASRFSRKYPKVEIMFSFSDRFVDLVTEGIDVAIRAGRLKDSSLVAKKLGTTHWTPYASPRYLRNGKVPTHPKELQEYGFIHFTPFGSKAWELTKGSMKFQIIPRHVIGANDINFTKALCLKGEGIALLPTFSCFQEVSAGRLLRLVPDWVAYSSPLHVVYPRQKFMPAKVRAFVNTVVDEFAEILKK